MFGLYLFGFLYPFPRQCRNILYPIPKLIGQLLPSLHFYKKG